MDFIALDFETATHERNSACEIGICLVENGKIANVKSWLIKPPSFPYFNPRNIGVHGITPTDVIHSPSFLDIWQEIEEYFYGNLMIAHNASFDASVLKSCLDYYGIFAPRINYLCSITLAKKSWKNLKTYGLKSLAEINNIQFTHHRAGADAEVCAKISLLALDKLQISSNLELNEFFTKNIKRI